MQADMVVIGGGIAGSCLAAAVAQKGWHVVLVERQSASSHKVCGEFLSPESQHSLNALGLYDAIAVLEPALMTHARFVSRQGVQLSLRLPGTAWGVSRLVFDGALRSAAATMGATVFHGVTALNVRNTQNGKCIDIRDEEGSCSTITTRAVVGAAGRHALPALRPAAHGIVRNPLVGIKRHYSGLRLGPEVTLYLFDSGYIGLSPVEDGYANACMLVDQAAFRRAGASVDAMFDAALRGNRQLAADIDGAFVVPDSTVTVAAVDTNRVPVVWDGYARIGDAVAMIPPLCGDGMAMAIRSAELCAPFVDQFLADQISELDWETNYRAAWEAGLRKPMRTGRTLQWALNQSWMSNALLTLGTFFPTGAQYLVRATRTA